jgi:hypothetical protein
LRDYDDIKKRFKENFLEVVIMKGLETFVTNALKDEWAFWLDEVQEEISKASDSSCLT